MSGPGAETDAEPEQPLDVLYIHHTGVFGGASRSLMELIRGFPEGTVRPHAIVQRGVVPSMLKQAGFAVLESRGIAQFDCTRYGYYRGLRWLILLRELFYLPFTLAALLLARRRWPRIDLVHINDTTPAATIAFARRIFRCPVVVHARAVLGGAAIPHRMRWLGSLLARHAGAVIAIDETVQASLPAGVEATVVHNGFAPKAIGVGAPPDLLARLSPTSLKVAMIGSLSPMKGVFEFIRAAFILAEKGLDVDCILVGEDVRSLKGLWGSLLRRLGFAHSIRWELERMVRHHGLEQRVHFLGFIAEIETIYAAIDLVCFPSELDAPGRPVFEAAFFNVPAIVAMSHPLADTLIDGKTGICIPARDARALANAMEYFCNDRAALKRMGEQARALALKNFDSCRNAEAVLQLYRTLLARKAC